MSDSATDRLVSRKYLENAQGYLELASLFEDRWELPPALKSVLATHARHSLNLAWRDHLDPVTWYLLRGQAFRLQGNLDHALSLWQLACQHGPDHIEAHLQLAAGFQEQQDWPAAILALQVGLERHPAQSRLWYALARCHCQAGQDEECLDCLTKALRLSPSLRSAIEDEPDLIPIRSHPRFLALRDLAPN